MFLEKKRHIKLLADKFAYSINYDKNSILLSNSFNCIRITDKDKYSVLISYDIHTGSINHVANEEDIIDTLYELLKRENLGDIKSKYGNLLTIKDYIDGEGHFFEKKFKEVIIQLKTESNIYKNIGGNRIEGEIYNDTLILVDSLMSYKTNMIDLKEYKL